MAVTWVSGTIWAESGGAATFAANLPTALADGDLVIAAVFTRSALTVPAGWTKLYESAPIASKNNHQLTCLTKNTVVASNSGSSQSWTQTTLARIGVVYAAFRGAEVLDGGVATKVVDDWIGERQIDCPVISVTGPGQALAIFATSWGGYTDQNLAAPAGFTIFSGNNVSQCRISGAYSVGESPPTTAGVYNFKVTNGGWLYANGLAAISLLIGSTAPPEEGGAIVLPALTVTGRQFGRGVGAATLKKIIANGGELSNATVIWGELVRCREVR